MTDTPDIELVERLLRRRSVTNRWASNRTGRLVNPDGLKALVLINALLADIAARDTHWLAWLAREGISYDKWPDGMPKGWGKR